MTDDTILDNPSFSEDEHLDFFARPSLISRVKATFVDLVVVLLLMMGVAAMFSGLGIDSGNVRFLVMGAILLYEPIMICTGATIGQRMMGLKVVKYSSYLAGESENKIHFGFSILRYLGKTILGWISLIFIHRSDYGQALHDKLGNSLVIWSIK